MHYIVSIDRSDESVAAIEAAARRAERDGGTLTLVHATEPHVSPSNGHGGGNGLVREGMDAAVDRGQAIISWGERALNDLDVDVDTDIHLISDTDRPVDALADYVESTECDGVFVGHRALTERTEAVVGSFAKSLISRCDAPVTVVSAGD